MQHPLRRGLPQPRTADPVGPIRSGRTQDIDLLGSLNQPLFVWSGGNAQRHPGHRAQRPRRPQRPDDARAAPAASSAATTARGAAQPVRAARRCCGRWRPSGAGAAAAAVPRTAPPGEALDRRSRPPASICDMDGVAVELDLGRRQRPATSAPATASRTSTRAAARSAPTTSSCMIVDYQPSPADAAAPRRRPSGQGDVLVFTGGVMVARHLDPRRPPVAGRAHRRRRRSRSLLTPGRTWVELARRRHVTRSPSA